MTWSPGDALRALAYGVFRRLPLRCQQLVAGLRSRVRAWRGFSHVLGRYVRRSERLYVEEIARKFGPDLILYDTIFNVCGRVCDAQHWVITHDVKHERAASFAAQGYAVLPRAFEAAFERDALRSVGNVIAIQPSEAATFRTIVPEARVITVPVALDAPERRGIELRDADRCIFVANATLTNVDGLRWFLASCWPSVKAAHPAARLDVYGSIATQMRHLPPGVTVHGYVADLSAAYACAAAAIVPLRIGSGLKLKLIEALAHGVPVVTTPVGAQGLGGLRPLPFLLAGDAAGFSAAVVRLLRTPVLREELSRDARSAAARYQPRHAFAEFAEAAGSPDERVER
jgi:succinoglycan biosynthesis protein ExoO